MPKPSIPVDLKMGHSILRDPNIWANLEPWDLPGMYFAGADLHGAKFRKANLAGTNLRHANLAGADLRKANLRGADLREADLRGADLREADLTDADLREANLRGADLREANLTDADLREADLEDADFRKARLSGTKFAGALASGVNFERASSMKVQQLNQARFGNDHGENETGRRIFEDMGPCVAPDGQDFEGFYEPDMSEEEEQCMQKAWDSAGAIGFNVMASIMRIKIFPSMKDQWAVRDKQMRKARSF